MDSMQASRQRRVLGPALILGVVCLAAAGCNNGFSTVPVSGIVTLDGQPVAHVLVNFQPIGNATATPGPGSHGITGPDGRYTLQLSTPESPSGALIGQHRVRLTLREPASKSEGPTSRQSSPVKLPPNASDGSLTFTVPASGTAHANFALTSQ